MGKVLIIGAGGVATVAAHKVAQNTDVFRRNPVLKNKKQKSKKPQKKQKTKQTNK